jgi:hypothetical protein
MTDSELEHGPVDYLIVEWPAGKEPTGEGLALLADYTDMGLIQILDLAFVRKNEDGTVSGLALVDLDADGELDLVGFEGVSSGLLDQDDYNEAGAALEPGASAAILLYENRWARPFVTAVRRSGAQLVASGRIPADTLVDVVSSLESTTA